MNYTISSASPDEGQPFWIDASGSTDADGDALTISVRQISGPPTSEVPIYESVPAGEGIFAFRAPEVGASAVLEFEIAVSDGEVESTDIVAVTATNIVLGPEADILGTIHRTFEALLMPLDAGVYSNDLISYGTPDSAVQQDLKTGILGVMDSEDGNGRVLFRYPSDNQIQEFGEIDKIRLPHSSGESQASLTTVFVDLFYSPIVWMEAANKLYVMSRYASDQMYLAQEHDVEAPCAVSHIQGESSTKYYMVVGKRGGGLQLFPQMPMGVFFGVGEYEPGAMLADTGSFCSIYTTNLEVAAYDSERSEIRVWTYRKAPTFAFTEVASLPIELPETDLELVDVEIRYSYIGLDQGFIAAFLFSDGEHDGQHELHVFSNGYRGGEPTQSKVFTWDKGRPVEVEYIPYMDGTDREGLAVVLETAPYMIWIPDNGTRYSTDLYPEFEELFYVPTGLWLSSVREGPAGSFGKYSLTLTYNKLGKVVLRGVINLP
ncbi:hypothetical protein [uncultured Hyphomonas sp.]|uniref:hypothetical protein n=1 Tax=uncultured Hyphomonas sp. TaxID=225298 RepID=UPI002AABAE61|nr:hypothetical protein [uncultured Hyphomonas sp.]